MKHLYPQRDLHEPLLTLNVSGFALPKYTLGSILTGCVGLQTNDLRLIGAPAHTDATPPLIRVKPRRNTHRTKRQAPSNLRAN